MDGAIKFLSVCSGIEAASEAWGPLGWRAAALAEIDPFACYLLHHRHGAGRPLFMPDPAAANRLKDQRARKAALKAVSALPEAGVVPNFGDLEAFRKWPDATIDLLVGGTPCQSFSVAGLRKGLDDPRGNLALVYLAIAERYRPRWIVWENVPGVLSSNRGRDFGAFLGALGELGYGWDYRVLDAQYIRTRRFPGAVPQRRRRVFVIGYLGSWQRAAAVLFDAESLRGNSPPRREAGQGTAPTISARPSGGGGLGTDFDCDGGLISTALGQGNADAVGMIAPAITRNPYGDNESREGLLVAHTLRGEGFDASEDGSGRGMPIVPVAFDCKGTQVAFADDGSHPTLRSMGHSDSHSNAGGHAAVAFSLTAGMANSGCRMPSEQGALIPDSWAVRRLTPRECERLQGFEDDYTLIPYRNGRPAADGPRYKALGNSMAVNAMEWIGQRIAMVDAMNDD
jgi:DNA (cytosine-5)-methyltransferase 1